MQKREGRLEKYYALLKDIYGEELLENNYFTIKEGQRLRFEEDKIEINNNIIKYNRNNQGCVKCEEKFIEKKIKFFERPQEFPGWLNYLDFNDNNHAKKFMIIGEAAGPKLKTHINVTFGLGNLIIDDEGKLDLSVIDDVFLKKNWDNQEIKEFIHNLFQKKDLKITDRNIEKLKKKAIKKFKDILLNELWKKLRELFSNKSEFRHFIDNTYITDIVKCNYRKSAKIKSNLIWKDSLPKCVNFLYNEINLINPKKIIFLGNTGYNKLKKLKQKEIEFDETAPTKDIIQKNPLIPVLKEYNFRNDYYLQKCYDNLKPKFKEKIFQFNDEEKEKIIKERFLPKEFPIYGTIKLKDKESSIDFLKIFHTSPSNRKFWEIGGGMYINPYKKLMKKLIIQEL